MWLGAFTFSTFSVFSVPERCEGGLYRRVWAGMMTKVQMAADEALQRNWLQASMVAWRGNVRKLGL